LKRMIVLALLLVVFMFCAVIATTTTAAAAPKISTPRTSTLHQTLSIEDIVPYDDGGDPIGGHGPPGRA